MLTDNQRKHLTELIGEKWIPNIGKYECCGNRTFTTPDDFFAVFRKLERWPAKEVFQRLGVDLDYQQIGIMIGIMQQPTFIEDFMREVARMGGIE